VAQDAEKGMGPGVERSSMSRATRGSCRPRHRCSATKRQGRAAVSSSTEPATSSRLGGPGGVLTGGDRHGFYADPEAFWMPERKTDNHLIELPRGKF